MGIAYNPRTITDGLVLCLDAANPKSYPGSGTIWTDLSGNGNNGTLVNGVGYSGSNLGSLSFDGVDDYVSTSLNVGPSNFGSAGFTFNLALKVVDDGATDVRRMLFGKTSFNVDGFGFGFNHDLSNSNIWSVSFYPSNNIAFFGSFTPDFGNIEFLTFLYDGNNIVQLYKNGNLLSSLTLSGTRTYKNDTMFIGSFNQGGWSVFLGNIYLFQGYNRALTAQEIQQNFIATRSRFGI
jgi:hypothetical protein